MLRAHVLDALRRVMLLANLALSIAACASVPTQLVVRIDSDLPTGVEPPVAGDRVLRAVRVEICEPSCDRVDAPRVERRWAIGGSASSGRVALPFSFGVAPHDPEAPARVEIRVEALRVATDVVTEADVLFATRRVTAFSPGRRLDVSIFLSAGCLGDACPAGTACDDEGQCAPVEGLDAGPLAIDGGLDAHAAIEVDAAQWDADPEDAGVDAVAHDVGLDAGVDAAISDVGVDASPDAPPCMLPTSEPAPTSLVGEREQGFNGGWVMGVATTPGGGRLASGTYTNPTPFTWEGDSVRGPTLFVSRVEGLDRWTVFPRIVGTFERASFLSQLAERDGVVYAAGRRVEGWTITADGVTATLPALTDAADSSLRSGVVLLALDAATGRPLWHRTLETAGAGDYLEGMVVDEDGILLAWRSLPSATSTHGALTVDGVERAIDRGPVDGRVRLARFDTSGTVRWVHTIGGASFAGADLASTEDGAILSLLVTRLLDGSTGLVGLDPAPPEGPVVIMRLDRDGAPRWSRSVRCASGTFVPTSGAISQANGRVYASFLARTPSLDTECSALAIGPGAVDDPVLLRGEAGPNWFTTLALDTCGGELAVSQLFGAAVRDAPGAAIKTVTADARGVVVTGYAGSGGFTTSSGTIAGRDPGGGTDGFIAVLTPSLDRRFFLVFGPTAFALDGVDDYTESAVLLGDTLHLALALSGAQTLAGLSVESGARLVRFGLR